MSALIQYGQRHTRIHSRIHKALTPGKYFFFLKLEFFWYANMYLILFLSTKIIKSMMINHAHISFSCNFTWFKKKKKTNIKCKTHRVNEKGNGARKPNQITFLRFLTDVWANVNRARIHAALIYRLLHGICTFSLSYEIGFLLEVRIVGTFSFIYSIIIHNSPCVLYVRVSMR